MFGIREESPSSVAIFLFASISFVRSSPDTSIGGFGGSGAGRKDSYAISPDRLPTSVPARFVIIVFFLRKMEIEIFEAILAYKFQEINLL